MKKFLGLAMFALLALGVVSCGKGGNTASSENSVKIVNDMDQAMMHITEFGSSHTETIVTSDYKRARRFVHEIDSSVVLVNASTRFNDGGQLGLGAEIGISTSKLHAFGPMGVEELTTTKFIVFGDGQLRK